MSSTELCKNLLRVTLPTVAAVVLILEITFRLVVPASDPPMGWFDEDRGIYRFSTDRGTGLATIGPLAQQRSRWRINNEGWNSPVDYARVKTTPRIAVIGDSYIESFQVDTDKNFPSLLRKALTGEYDVYSFGVSGAPLSQYLHVGRYVVETFDPDIVVVNIVHNDFSESIYRLNPTNRHWLLLQVQGDRITEIPPRTNYSFTQYSMAKRLLRKSALARYLIFNLGVRELIKGLGEAQATYDANTDLAVVADNREDIGKAVRYTLAQMRTAFRGRQVLLVLDAPRNALYSGQVDQDLEFLHNLMAEVSREVGFQLIDLTGPMRAAYAENGTRFESAPDGHWNEYGHAFVAKIVEGVLRKRFGG